MNLRFPPEAVIGPGRWYKAEPAVAATSFASIAAQASRLLKRHISTDHQMTPDEYRIKLGLSRDYPMVAPEYAATINKAGSR